MTYVPEVVQSFMSLFADDTKLFHSIVSDLDVALLQADIDSFLIWSKNWLLNLSISKNWDLKLFISQILNSSEFLCTTIAEMDLGVVIDQDLIFHQQAAAKANCILGLINKCFEHLDIDTLPLLYYTFLRPILEYANTIWGPYYITNQKLLKRVQKSYQTCIFFKGTTLC